MRWVRNMRASGLVEWEDDQGCGHPDPLSVEYLNNRFHSSENPPSSHYGIHGCNGSCSREDFPGNPANCKPVVGADPEYRVYTTGDVWSNKRHCWMRFHEKKGYDWIQLRYRGRHTYKSVHRIVAEAFIPNPENKRCVNHKDFDTHNNCVENLEWMTDEENNLHSYLHGRKPPRPEISRRNGKVCCKLTPDEVRKIRQDYKNKVRTQAQMAKDYGMHRNSIGRVCRLEKYKDVN
jgi:hypothetical protein